MAEADPPRASAHLVLTLATVAGAGTMTVELAAVRLLAPWFGTSLVVWTNVIGVILLALSLGYLVGARLSAGALPLARLGGVLCVAAAFTAWLPFGAGAVAELFLPSELALDEAAALILWGSLAASLVLFLPPATLLGAVAPLAVEAVQRVESGHAGRAGGRVLAASTAGSLVGVFGTSHWFVPGIGLSATFLGAACAFGLAGLVAVLLGRGAKTIAAAALLAVGGGLVLSRATGPDLAEGWELLAAEESAYQSVRVAENVAFDPPMRHLQVNEGFDSFQSVWQPEPGLLPEGYYYNYFALPLHWSGGTGRFRVQVLGLGAGTAWRVLEGASPAGLTLDLAGVELDPTVLDLARAHMDLVDGVEDRRVASGVDARVALRAPDEPWDLVVLDCYANQVEIPPHLSTREFFAAVRERLAPGGWLAANLGGFGFDDPVVSAVASTCSAAFDAPVLLVRVPSSRNFVLYARRGGGLPLEGEGLAAPAGEVARRLLAQLEVPGSFRVVSDGGLVLTDDQNPIDKLELRSLREGRARLAGAGG